MMTKFAKLVIFSTNIKRFNFDYLGAKIHFQNANSLWGQYFGSYMYF